MVVLSTIPGWRVQAKLVKDGRVNYVDYDGKKRTTSFLIVTAHAKYPANKHAQVIGPVL